LHFACSRKNKKRQSANVRASLEDGVLYLLSDGASCQGGKRCPPKVAVNVTVQMRDCRERVGNVLENAVYAWAKMPDALNKIVYATGKMPYVLEYYSL
jgi:hypothetical protein